MFFPLLFLLTLLVLPLFFQAVPLAAACSLPSSVLRIHLQMKQIYHSVTQAGLWNALAAALRR